MEKTITYFLDWEKDYYDNDEDYYKMDYGYLEDDEVDESSDESWQEYYSEEIY